MHGDIAIPQRQINEADNYANLSKDNTGKSVPTYNEDAKQQVISVAIKENPEDGDDATRQSIMPTDNADKVENAMASMAAGRISGQYYTVEKQEHNIAIDLPKYVASTIPDIVANVSACNDYEIAVGESTCNDMVNELVPTKPEFTDDKKDSSSNGSTFGDNNQNVVSKYTSDDLGTSQYKGSAGSRSCHPVIHSKENASENIGSKTRRVMFSEDTRTDYTNWRYNKWG